MRNKIFMLLLMIISTTAVMAQSISGTVRDENGNVMPFATVSVKDLKTSVTSDSKGCYQVSKVSEGHHTLIASFVGYETQEVDVNVSAPSVTLDFIMKEATVGLNEVVILPEGQTLQYYILSQVVENHRNFKDLISSYDGLATCRVESMADYKAMPSSLLKTINFFMALIGYKKVMKCMENHPDLRIEMAKDITFRDGKLKASDTRITAFSPKELTNDECSAFKNKDWDMDKNVYDDIYNAVEKYKNSIDKIRKKHPEVPVDSFFHYKGCYQEGKHIIHILTSEQTEIHIVNGLWQVRRCISEKSENGDIDKKYYELQELAPDLYLPVSAYKEQSTDWTSDIDKSMERVKNTDVSKLSKHERKKMEQSVQTMERMKQNPVWSMIHSLGFSYKNVRTTHDE